MTRFMQVAKPDFVKFQSQVMKMNYLAGNRKEDYPELIPTYEGLMIEEAKEMVAGFNEKDAIKFLDGIVDFGVIGIYLYLLKQGVERYPVQAVGMVDDYDFEYLVNNAYFNCTRDIDQALAYWEDICSQLDGVDINGAMNEIMMSNMSKFPRADQVDPLVEVKFIEGQSRYSDISHDKVEYEGNSYYVFKARYDLQEGRDYGDKGKFVKCSTFVEPNLVPFINWEGLKSC